MKVVSVLESLCFIWRDSNIEQNNIGHNHPKEKAELIQIDYWLS